MSVRRWITGTEIVPTWWRIVRSSLLLLASLVLCCALLTYQWLRNLGVFSINERMVELITHHTPSDNSLVFDRNGVKIGEFFHRYHHFVPYEEIPRSMIAAILAIEDRNFFRHEGIDFRAILRATMVTISGREITQGASTITQQLVRNFLLTRSRTIDRKVLEMVLAIHLERRFAKERILELYLNTLFLGHGSYGIGAAAYRYFGKDARDLAPHETALIAGLFQSPSNFNPHRFPERARNRQRQVITAMHQAGMISRETAREIYHTPLVYQEYLPVHYQIAPYFVDYVREQSRQLLGNIGPESRGLRIYTTLDSQLQTAALQAFAQSEEVFARAERARLQNRRVRLEAQQNEEMLPVEGALISTDTQTGEILTMIGGRDYRISKFNRSIQAQRSPGSAFKPVVYSLALINGRRWSDMFFVSPISISSYRPRNYSDDFLTETTMLRAFFRSLNTTTVEIGHSLGLNNVIQHAQNLGIHSPLKDEPGTMLGSSEVNMLDLARMYATFANGGFHVDTYAITRIENRHGELLYQRDPAQHPTKSVLSPQVAYLMLQGLRSVLQFGTASASSHHASYAAGKTGTSNESQDNWFCGITRNLATIVWVGTDDHAPLHGRITGGALALPIWDRYLQTIAAQNLRPLQTFPQPSGIVSARIHPQYGHRSQSGVTMYFRLGQVPQQQHSDIEEVGMSTNFRSIFDL